MSIKPPSKSVFVGNIPYGLTEEQIIRIFSSAGKVLNFRLVYDRETGRPKGFGFVEFPDSDSAASAVRNLNDYEIMNRKLRVDFSNDGAEEDAQPAPMSFQPPPMAMAMPPNGISNSTPAPQHASSIPPLPNGIELPPNLSCPDAISRTLNTLPPAQLLDVLSQMKTLATTDAARATELLRQAPQLSYAIFQALLLMGLVSTEALTSVVEAASAPPPVPQQQHIPQQHHQQQQPNYSVPPPGAYPAGFPPPPLHMSGQMGMQMGTPPTQGQGLYPPPPPPPPIQRQPPPQQQQPQPNLQDTNALMQQVMDMPQELIDQLPPAERAQILALRASFGR